MTRIYQRIKQNTILCMIYVVISRQVINIKSIFYIRYDDNQSAEIGRKG